MLMAELIQHVRSCWIGQLGVGSLLPPATGNPFLRLSVVRSTTALVTPFFNPLLRPISLLHPPPSPPSIHRSHRLCPCINATYLHISNNHPALLCPFATPPLYARHGMISSRTPPRHRITLSSQQECLGILGDSKVFRAFTDFSSQVL